MTAKQSMQPEKAAIHGGKPALSETFTLQPSL